MQVEEEKGGGEGEEREKESKKKRGRLLRKTSPRFLKAIHPGVQSIIGCCHIKRDCFIPSVPGWWRMQSISVPAGLASEQLSAEHKEYHHDPKFLLQDK